MFFTRDLSRLHFPEGTLEGISCPGHDPIASIKTPKSRCKDQPHLPEHLLYQRSWSAQQWCSFLDHSKANLLFFCHSKIPTDQHSYGMCEYQQISTAMVFMDPNRPSWSWLVCIPTDQHSCLTQGFYCYDETP